MSRGYLHRAPSSQSLLLQNNSMNFQLELRICVSPAPTDVPSLAWN